MIQEGAKAVTSVRDILEELDITMAAEQQEARLNIPKSDLEERIWTYLLETPHHVDEIVRELGLETAEVMSTLTLMELKGLVRQVGPMEFRAVQ